MPGKLLPDILAPLHIFRYDGRRKDGIDYSQNTPSLSQAQRLKKLSREGKCTQEAMRSIMSEEKKEEQERITLSSDTLRKYFPRSYTPCKCSRPSSSCWSSGRKNSSAGTSAEKGRFTRDCTMHYIPTQKIEAAILSAIQRVSWYVQNNETDFIQRVQEAWGLRQEESIKEYRQRLTQAKKRYTELNGFNYCV